ncbi:MAG TPA: exodeoxyribonuclease VII large subunit [Candidatus Acidoferrum sp.]|jgi:exodeoxyribonuclease VII large subunit|nr:exodeoxyribonuclease VII large subunit [Candidatus Acidoferrum sp.]
MARPVKSQWDFGELFPAEQTRKVLSVGELTAQIRRLLEKEVGQVWVTGEVTNLRLQSSGHIYFTLKDAAAQLNCVLFRGELQVDRSLLQDGRKVTLRGDVTVYEPRGQYQLRVTAVELEGAGALQAAFEKLKAKLKAEGLFAPERKRPLPRYPERIGIVTSPTGAAIRDVLHVIQRRNPALEIILAPCRVQGDGAAAEIAAAIRMLNEFTAMVGTQSPASPPPTMVGTRSTASLTPASNAGDAVERVPTALDLILVTRGGGSLEDLWAFNEEVVARAIFESALPVVSAVGHEIDFTISDFVADLRAATPSAAAELITEGVFSSRPFVAEGPSRLRELVGRRVEEKREALSQAKRRLGLLHPRRRLNDWLQRLDDLQSGMLRSVKQGARQQRVAWQNLAERLSRVRPALVIKQRREVLQQAGQRLREQTRHRLGEAKTRFDAVESRLRLLGPEQVLARGYSITMDAASGKVIREAQKVKGGQRLRTRVKEGEIRSTVEE